MRRINATRIVKWLGLAAAAWWLVAGLWGRQPPAAAQNAGYSLRFYGHGVNDIDRVKVPLDNPARPVDVGGDFTLEFWLKALPGENASRAAACNINDGWITGNILLDRDIWGGGDYGDYGVSLSDGRVVFGVSRGSSGTTVCGASAVTDGAWHHVALTRRASDGRLSVFVDGRLEAQAAGPLGDVSYRDGRATGYANDRYLVFGAEKHDAGAEYPSFRGWLDEVRLSTTVRYTADFARPQAPFTPDADTAALYRFDEGPAGPCQGAVLDSSGAAGGPSDGVCRYGGNGAAGPVYDTDTPFAAVTASATPAAATATPVAPGATPTATNPPPSAPSATATPLPSATPAPTSTLAPTAPLATDLIFADSFEGPALAWTASVTDSGDLGLSSAAALVGQSGLQLDLDDNVSLYVMDETPAGEPRYRARFYFDPNGIAMATNDQHYLLYGYSGSSRVVLRVEFGRSSTGYRLRAALAHDSGAWTNTAWAALTDAPHFVEVDWRAASAAGANDGGLTFWVDGSQRAALAGVDNDQRRIDRVRFGAVAGVDNGTRGRYFLDAFESRRVNYIGPAAGSQTAGSPTATAAATATPTLTPTATRTATAAPTQTASATPTTIAAAPTSTMAPSGQNYALAFDGRDDVVQAGQTPGVGPLTVEAWVRPAAAGSTGLLVVGSDADRGWSLELDGGRLVFYIATSGGWRAGWHPAQLQAGQWYHVAATYEAGTVHTFVNGVGARTTGLGTLLQGPALSFGGLPGYPFFAGALDEVRVSGVTRYTTDFQPPAGPFTPDAGTLGLWHFDEGAGPLARDASAAANHATLGVSSGTDDADPAWVAGLPWP